MRQLLDLRATIHQLRGFRFCHSFGSSLAVLGKLSLNDVSGSESEPNFDVILDSDATYGQNSSYAEAMGGFQNRTVSMVAVTDGASLAL